MANYHLYFLNDNRLVGNEDIDAADDDEAARIAKGRGKGEIVAVWDARARVRVVAPGRRLSEVAED